MSIIQYYNELDPKDRGVFLGFIMARRWHLVASLPQSQRKMVFAKSRLCLQSPQSPTGLYCCFHCGAPTAGLTCQGCWL